MSTSEARRRHIRALGAEDCPPLTAETTRFLRIAAGAADPVLLIGETGVGKTWLARLIHRGSQFASGPFVHVNCASIPEHLFEREMFGNLRGAFTDAREARPGLIEEADGGTLFLDEIGELPLLMQPKLLHVLEAGMVRRLGATRAVPARFRLICATNRNLEFMMRDGAFREDLYYRCAVLQHRVPLLRERRSDIAAIVTYLQQNAERAGAPLAPITPDAMRQIKEYSWPGNLRELENSLRQATAYACGGPIESCHLPDQVRHAQCGATHDPGRQAPPGSCYIAPADPAEEAAIIQEALRSEGGNRTRAARRLGMSRATLWIKMQKYAQVLVTSQENS